MVTRLFNKFTGRSDMFNEVEDLVKEYTERRQGFTRWYDLLKLKDQLAQDDMESYVGNDPRTIWNMSVYLLQPRPLVSQISRVDGVPLTASEQMAASTIVQYFNRIWVSLDRSEIHRGKSSWFRNFVGLLTATGWAALPYTLTPRGVPYVDYWHPGYVFPEFPSTVMEGKEWGLRRLAYRQDISASSANHMAKANGWEVPDNRGSSVTWRQLWKRMEDGRIYHGVMFDSTVAKPMTPITPARIPVVVGVAGGLVDDGLLDSQWSQHTGQSILATNEPIFMNFNKQQTFLQQLMRDTANPRVIVKNVSRKLNINPDNWYKRGAIYEAGSPDSVEIVQMPGVPVELTQLIFNLRNQMQRGGFSDLTFGNVVQEVTAILISQAAEAAMQLLSSYQSLITSGLSIVADSWYQSYLANPELRPRDWPTIDADMLLNTQLTCDYSIRIPGDLNNRIGMARQLNNNLQLPADWVITNLLPEVVNVREAIEKVDAEKAKDNSLNYTILLIRAFDRVGEEFNRRGDSRNAQLYNNAASMLRQQVSQTPASQQQAGPQGVPAGISGLGQNISAQMPRSNPRLGDQ